MKQQNDLFAQHGGVHFTNNVSPEEINNYVRQLPASKRDSLFEVLQSLSEAGLITIYNDHVFVDGEGKLGGSEEC